MALRLFDRIGTLVRADAHGALDALEDRALLIRQHLREAELELLQKRARLEALDQEADALRDEAERMDAELAALDEDVRLALAGDKEDLARFAIRRLLPRRADAKRLADRIDDLTKQREQLGERLAEQESELESLRARARSALARGRVTPAEDLLGGTEVAEEEVEMELLRRRRGEEVA